MIQEKIIYGGLSFIATYTMAIVNDILGDIFPAHLFTLSNMVYGVMGSLIYTMIEVYGRQSRFVAKIEGALPISNKEIFLFTARLIFSGIFNVIFYAALISYLKVSESTYLAPLVSKEACILIGVAVGILFEFVSSKSFHKSLVIGLKQIVASWLNNAIKILTKND